MMTANKDRLSLEHDTTMCGAHMDWFPMRVTYSRELKVKAELDRLDIENFIPVTYKLVNTDTENPHRKLVPTINCLFPCAIYRRRFVSRSIRVKHYNRCDCWT